MTYAVNNVILMGNCFSLHMEHDMSEASTDPMKEIEAMRGVAKALDDLDDRAKRRVLDWAADRYTGGAVKTGAGRAGEESENDVDAGDDGDVDGILRLHELKVLPGEPRGCRVPRRAAAAGCLQVRILA